MEKYLYCHTSKHPFFTKGRLYLILEQTKNFFLIICDDEKPHKLSKLADWEGVNYESYMTLDLPLNGGVNAPKTFI